MPDPQAAFPPNVCGPSSSELKNWRKTKPRSARILREVYSEAKGTGFDAKIIRKIVSLRRVEVKSATRKTELLELYKSALGMEE